MRNNFEHQLSRLERQKSTKTFRRVFVRGDTPEEQEAELSRLKQAGLARDNDWVIYEPRIEGKPLSNIIEMPMEALMRELQNGKHGKIIVDDGTG